MPILRKPNNDPAEELPDLLDPRFRQPGAGAEDEPPQIYVPPADGPASAPQMTEHKNYGIVTYSVLGLIVVIAAWIGWEGYTHLPQDGDIPHFYIKSDAPDGVLTCRAPLGWAMRPTPKGDQAVSSADSLATAGTLYKSGDVKIDITEVLTSRLVAQSAKTSVPPAAVPTGYVSTALAVAKSISIPYVTDFKFGKSANLTSKLGPFAVAEWTGTGSSYVIKYPLHGYTAAAPYGDETVVIVCKATDDQWSDMQPVFQKVIMSLAPGPKMTGASTAL